MKPFYFSQLLSNAKEWISSLTILRSCYNALPLSIERKWALRRIVSKHFPWLLVAGKVDYGTIGRFDPETHKPEELEVNINPKQLIFQTSDTPEVSIVIPVFGQIDFTLRCLKSIIENLPRFSFEIIIVDDCSNDNTADSLLQVTGIRVIKNETNLGFIRSCNKGAAATNGKYVLFLNNDIKVLPNWMDELVRTFDEFPGTGLVGSKLIYPDGRLQEAGGIIWSDGSTWNFGRFENPDLPIFNYAREVDYCSGASIMLPSKLFQELSGFSEDYLPAYCEDSDLALAVREAGYRVIYQPLSCAIHFEGTTSGTNPSSGVKAYQANNTKKLFQKWGHLLSNYQQPGKNVDTAKDRRAKQRVLVFDQNTPRPNNDAGSITVLNLLLLLREMDFQVTFIPDNLLYIPSYTSDLQRVGIEVLYTPFVPDIKKSGARYDLVFIFRPDVMSRYGDIVRQYCPSAKLLYHTVDLHYLRMEREAQLEKNKTKQASADEMKLLELKGIAQADASIVHSTVELELLGQELPQAKLSVFPLILDILKSTASFSERKHIAFIGGYQHPPNTDAVFYFVTEVMPLLRKRLPGVRFYAIGSNAPRKILELACDDVIITGFVEELNPLLEKMRVSVVPLRFGAGIKGKIGSAMAVGLPVVSTPIGVEGMSLKDGENILVAEQVNDFVDKVVQLYEQQELWDRISTQGLQFARENWGDEAAWRNLAEILVKLGIPVNRGNHPLSLYEETPNHLNKNK